MDAQLAAHDDERTAAAAPNINIQQLMFSLMNIFYYKQELQQVKAMLAPSDPAEQRWQQGQDEAHEPVATLKDSEDKASGLQQEASEQPSEAANTVDDKQKDKL